MQDLNKIDNVISLDLDELVSIIREYIISELKENVEIIYGRYDRNLHNEIDKTLKLEIKRSTQIFDKKMEFPVILTKTDIIDCMNRVLNNENENFPWKIVDITENSLWSVFNLSIQKVDIKENEDEQVIQKKA